MKYKEERDQRLLWFNLRQRAITKALGMEGAGGCVTRRPGVRTGYSGRSGGFC